MQGIHASITDISLERERTAGRAKPPVFLGAFVAATVGCLAAYGLHNRHQPVPDNRHQPVPAEVVTQATPVALPPPAAVDDSAAVENPEKLFGAMIVEPEWRAEIARTTATASPTTLASLGPEPAAAPPTPPTPTVASFPPSAPEAAPAAPIPPAAPEGANALSEAVPLPPIRDVPQIDDVAPLPPVRPSEFVERPPIPVAPDRRVALPGPGPVAAPADERNVFQRLLGFGQPSGAIVASRPPGPPVQPSGAIVASRPPGPPVQPSRLGAEPGPAAPAGTTMVARPPAPGEGRGPGGLFSSFSSSANPGRFGYDRQTAVYVISAHAVILPDGTRLEAHSGLGDRLDDVRFVHERARGPTPPHLYELTMREALFHGVQAIRLNPVGDGGVYGRAGLLAHPYMLGPNGESNGCVSFRDYSAFLRAYQSGMVNKLAVVTSL